jgi:subtilisin family serine protease
MKRTFVFFLCWLIPSISYARPNESLRTHVLRILSAQQKTEIASQFETQPITLGITGRQKTKIFELTQGEVDLRHMFFVRLPESVSNSIGFNVVDFGAHPDEPIPPHHGAPIAVPSHSEHYEESMDPDLIGQWWASKYRMTDVWKNATGKGVTIADCDTGFYFSESDLKFNLDMDNSKDLASLNGAGRIDDGRFVFHGTAVAALISGVRDARGTNGIAFNSKLVPLQYFNFDPQIDVIDKEEATARCVLHAIKIPGVKVIVVQNQTTTGSAETFVGTRDAIKLALKSGISVVSTAGNSSIELRTEELYDTGSIIVGAVHENGKRAVFSNYGPRVNIAAYGEKLYTLYGPSGRMDSFGGTTAASAQVAAAIALILEVNPWLTPDQVKEIIVSTAARTPANADVGGLLNILVALKRASKTEADSESLARLESFRAELSRILE